MLNSFESTVTLNNGVKMPMLGLGVMSIPDGRQMAEILSFAAEVGYRSFDTATIYGNEKGVGEGIRQCGIPRDELFITTKLWNNMQGYENALKAFDNSMKSLGLDYLDLYLLHWPLPMRPRYIETWRAFEKLYTEGRIHAIGVSNFNGMQIDEIVEKCEIKPMVNQVEFHPLLSQPELQKYHQQNEVQMEAWSPLGQGEVLKNPVVRQLAEKYGKTTAQIIIRWDLQKGIVTIPKSGNPERIKSNADVFNFELSNEDVMLIDSLNIGKRLGPHPDEFFAGCIL